MGRTPHSGMTAAGAQPPGPRLPNGRRAPVSWRRKGKDRPRRMPRVAVARPGRSHGPGRGRVWLRGRPHPTTPVGPPPLARKRVGAGGNEIIERKQGSGPFPDGKAGPGEKGVGPRLPSGMRRSNRAPVRLSPDILDTGRRPSVALTRGAVRFLRGVRSGPVRPDDSHPRERSGCCAWIRSPGRQAFLGSLNHPSWDDITSESIVASAPLSGRSISCRCIRTRRDAIAIKNTIKTSGCVDQDEGRRQVASTTPADPMRARIARKSKKGGTLLNLCDGWTIWGTL